MSSTRQRARAGLVAAAASGALIASALPAWAGSGPTAQVDVWPSDPSVSYENPSLPDVSDDGRVVVFGAQRVDTATGARANHVYARDRLTGTNVLVDVGSDGTPSDQTVSSQHDVSADGRYVVFVSSSDLVPGNPSSACVPPPDLDPDQEPPPCLQVYVRDLRDGTTTLVSTGPAGPANGLSSDPRISADGSRIVFASSADNLVAGDTNSLADVFVYDAARAEHVSRVSSTDTAQSGDGTSFDADISGDGRTVVFLSNAAGFTTGAVDNSPAANLFVSVDGAVPSPLVPASFAAELSDPTVNGDGSVVGFTSQYQLDPVVDVQPWTWDVFVIDRGTGVITSPSAGLAQYADRAQISADGQHLLFRMLGTVYVHDRTGGTTEVAAVDPDGLDLPRADSGFSSISGDGRFVGYWTYDSGVSHVWVHDRGAPAESATGTGSASTESEGDGATPLDPVETSVSGSTGAVSITDLGPGSSGEPAGYRVIGQQVSITAAPPEAGGYLTITLLIDGDAVPPGTDPGAVSLSRNGAVLPACAGSTDVGPCLASARLVGDDLELVAHTPAASVWAAVVRQVTPDREPPTVSIASPVDGSRVLKGARLTATYSCADTGGSGLASCSGEVATGVALDTAAVGARTFSVTATDGVGNRTTSSISYTVVYNVRGFYSLAAPPVVNDVKAGKVVPLVFSLAGNQGLGVLAGPPTSSPVTCPVRPRRAEVQSYLSSTTPALTYKASTQRYTAAWATSRSWKKGTCRDVGLTLVDGSSIRALVRIS